MELFNHKQLAGGYRHQQFVFFRMIFGTYLLFHFCLLFPYSSELFSNIGIISSSELNFTYGFFPAILFYYDSPLFVQLFLIILILASFFFIAGVQRRLCALLLWYGWTCLINRNNFIINPGMPYIGWLLLACAFIPSRKNNLWKMPGWAIAGAWLILSIGYLISGLDKLQSPSWVNGSTLSILLENPLCRDNSLSAAAIMLPTWVLKAGTWFVLLAEIIFLPLVIFNHTRRYAWTLMVIVHLGILCFINFTDLTVGMMMIHLFIFDVKWLHNKIPFKKLFFNREIEIAT